MADDPRSAAAHMRLRLTVETLDARRHDALVDADAAVSGGAFVDAVAEHFRAARSDPRAPPLGARDLRSGAWIGRSAPLSDAGVREGDILVLREASAEEERLGAFAPHRIVVTRGPDATFGQVLRLGELAVGRDPARCQVVINDPKVSAVHLRVRVSYERILIADARSTNGTRVQGRRLRPDEWLAVGPADAIDVGDTTLRIEAVPLPLGRSPDPAGLVPFNRPPRVTPRAVAAAIDLERPPDERQGSRLPLGTVLLPALFGGGVALLMQRPEMLAFALLSPLMALWSFVEDRRAGGQQYRRAARSFRDRVREAAATLAAAREREAEQRAKAAPAPAELVARATAHDARIWERRVGDPDFLELRLGLADRPSHVSVKIADGGSAALRAEAGRELGADAVLRGVPFSAPLARVGSVGLAGRTDAVASLARWLVVQAAVLHSPRDVAIVAAISAEQLSRWEWLKWLPHTLGDPSPLRRPHLATRPADAAALLEDVVSAVRAREQEAGRGGARSRPAPVVLVVMDELLGLSGSQIAKVLSAPPELGFVSIWLGSDADRIPGDCRAVAKIDGAQIDWVPPGDDEPVSGITADALGEDDAMATARALAALRDVSAEGAGPQIPQRLTLLELLGLREITPERVRARWAASRGDLAAPIGRTATSDLVLDLGRDGPHGLIAGTTGAGKSELLQTVIASFATAYPPDRLTFLLIDYKGGAAFRECVSLPHTVGIVTDLDEHLAERALVSLNAELKRRERLLDQAGAKDLPTLLRRDPAHAPARLVIVVDEFATLAKEVPAFVDGVVDVAQRGRSLGVHLLLATQRPAGVITPSIRANTNLRIALRVSDGAESDDVIGTPDAAAIARDVPGRGYARIGHNELVGFQAAYAGAHADATAGPIVNVADFGFGPSATPPRRAMTVADRAATELGQVVDAVRTPAADLARPAPPWLPPLREVVTLDEIAVAAEDAGPRAVIGLADEPSLQRQRPATFDLAADGSLVVYGTSGSGKTTLLRTIALSLAERHGPGEIQVYAIDLATGGLKVLEALPHCGSVIVGNDEERVARLLTMLRATIETRRRVLADAGASALADLGNEERSRIPRLLVLVNGYGGLVSAFERTVTADLVDAFPRLVADGRPAGVHFVIAAERRGVVPGSIAGVVTRRVVLRMSDEEEYLGLGLPRRVAKAVLPPGRGFVDDGIEVQCAVVSSDPSGKGQAAEIGARGSAMRERYGAADVWRVGLLPERLDAADLPRPAEPFQSVFAVRDRDLGPVAVSLAEGHFVVIGPYRSGRTTALEAMVASIIAGTPEVELHLLAPLQSRLAELGAWSSVARGAERCVGSARAIEARARDRGPGAPATVVVIDDGEELLEGEIADMVASIVRSGRSGSVRVLAAVERQAARRAFSGWFSEMKKDGRGLLLQPDLDIDGDLFSMRLPRASAPVHLPGRGYLVERGRADLVQVAVRTSEGSGTGKSLRQPA